MEARAPDEAEIVLRAQRGDAAAYEELVNRHTDIAFRSAYLLTGNAADAEEAAQDGFVKAWFGLPRFRPGAPFRPWLLEIVGNEARNRRRSAGRRAGLELRLAEVLRTGHSGPSVEATAAALEDRGELLRALLELDTDDRGVVACRHLLQLSVSETAAVLGLAEGTVKSRLHRALQRLRSRLERAHV